MLNSLMVSTALSSLTIPVEWHDLAHHLGVSTRALAAFLNTEEAVPLHRKIGTTENDNPLWSRLQDGSRNPDVPYAERRVVPEVPEVTALVPLPTPLGDDVLDASVADYRQKVLQGLPSRPKEAVIAKANLDIMRFKDSLTEAQKMKIRGEAAMELVESQKEIIAEKDKRLEILEKLVESSSNAVTPSTYRPGLKRTFAN